MCIVMIMLAPDYCRLMWNLPAGRSVLGMAFLLQILGWLAIRKIVDIKV